MVAYGYNAWHKKSELDGWRDTPKTADRQTNGQTNRKTHRLTDEQTDGQADRDRERHTDRQRLRLGDRETDSRQTDIHR